MSRLVLTSAAMVLALGAPAQAAAAEGCEAFQAFFSKSDKGLAGMAVEVARNGTLSVSYNGKRSGIYGARSCDVWRDDGTLLIDCDWKFASFEEAKSHFNVLLVEVMRCLGGGFEAQALRKKTESYRQLRAEDWVRSADMAEDSDEDLEHEVSIDVDLTEFFKTRRYYTVAISIERS